MTGNGKCTSYITASYGREAGLAASDKRERVMLLPRQQLRRWLDRLTGGAEISTVCLG